MIEVKNPTNSKPITYKTELEKEVYETLEKLDIPYTRVERKWQQVVRKLIRHTHNLLLMI